VVDAMIDAKSSGRQVFLVTASDETAARLLAAAHPEIDDVIGSTPSRNLKGSAKAALLIERFGQHGFDYIGDSGADMPVWAAARRGYVVGSRSASLRGRLGEGNPEILPAAGEKPRAFHLWKRALRPHQWTKNLLVLVPLLTSGLLATPSAVLMAAAASICFSMVASGTYVFNDIIDVQSDRQHPTKQLRPFASGDLPLVSGLVIAPLLAVLGMVTAFMILPALGTTLVVYTVATLSYTIRLKSAVLIDVITLAGLYTLRIFAGAVVLQVELSFWLLACSIFAFTSLALAKRYSEILRYPELISAAYNRRGYRAGDAVPVLALGTASGIGSVVILALYIEEGAQAVPYSSPLALWLVVPVVLYWISRTWIVAARGEMNDDPIVWATRDQLSLASGGAAAVLYFAARYL
jgi:4-hydroxybenzoate polyprenyltransferase